MDPRSKYAAEPKPPEPAKGKSPSERIENDVRFSVPAALLATFIDALKGIEREISQAEVEKFLVNAPTDKRAIARRAALDATHVAPAKPPKRAGGDTADQDPIIREALQLLQDSSTRPKPRHVDYVALLRELKDRRDLFREARDRQNARVETVRGQLSEERAIGKKAKRRALVVAQFKAAEAFAKATAAIEGDRAEDIAAGFIDRPDVTLTPTYRAALILGFASSQDSEIYRIGRMLADAKIL
ncbi:MAG TPA: hypothetical protein VGI90_09885 [Steroidobacteraceae bacterium]|jgi:hypothetical protein